MPHIPTPIRAALGLAATAVAEARKLPETLPQLPVAAVTTAMQASLRVQQHIATFAARGDEVISQLRGTSAEPPSWATFDESPAGTVTKAAFDRVEPANLEDAADLAEPGRSSADGSEPERFGSGHSGSAPAEPGHSEPAHVVPADTAMATSGQPVIPLDPDGASPSGTAATAPGQKAPPAKAVKKAAKKAPPAKAATKAPAKKVPPAKATAGKAPAKATAGNAPAKATAGNAPGKKAPAKKAVKKSEPLTEAARKADPSAGPNPSTMAAEILHAHQGESPDGQ